MNNNTKKKEDIVQSDEESKENEKKEESEEKKKEVLDFLTSLQEQIKADKERISELEKEIEELKKKENLIRERCADLINERETNKKHMTEAIKYGQQNLLKRLLFFSDSLENANRIEYKNEQEKKIIGSFLRGFQLCEKEIQKILSDHGIAKMKIKIGQDEFDAEKHEALVISNKEGRPANVVLSVLRSGYLLYDRVLRPASVEINKLTTKENKENKENNE